MHLEVGEQHQEDGQGQLEDLGYGADAVLGEGDAQVLFDGRYEHFVGSEHGSGALQDVEEELEGEDLGADLVGLGVGGSLGQRLHRELAEGAEHQEGVFLQHVREFSRHGGVVLAVGVDALLRRNPRYGRRAAAHLLRNLLGLHLCEDVTDQTVQYLADDFRAGRIHFVLHLHAVVHLQGFHRLGVDTVHLNLRLNLSLQSLVLHSSEDGVQHLRQCPSRGLLIDEIFASQEDVVAGPHCQQDGPLVDFHVLTRHHRQ
jgi:hypothetical protein